MMAHEREIAEEQEFLDLALEALDHMRQGARSLRDSAAVANMRGAGDLVERDVVMGTALHRLDQLAIGDQKAGGPIDSYAAKNTYPAPVDAGIFDLKEGDQTLTFTCVGNDPAGKTADLQMLLDYLKLEPAP